MLYWVGTIVFAALTATMAWGSADGATTNTAKLVTESTLIPSADADIPLYLWEKMPNVFAGSISGARKGVFRAMIPGVTMHRPNEPGYSVPGLFVLDDWRWRESATSGGFRRPYVLPGSRATLARRSPAFRRGAPPARSARRRSR